MTQHDIIGYTCILILITIGWIFAMLYMVNGHVMEVQARNPKHPDFGQADKAWKIRRVA